MTMFNLIIQIFGAVIIFLLGVMCSEIENDSFNRKLDENLMELKDIHQKLGDDDD